MLWQNHKDFVYSFYTVSCNKYLYVAMLTYSSNPSTWEGRQEDLKFKAKLGHSNKTVLKNKSTVYNVLQK